MEHQAFECIMIEKRQKLFRRKAIRWLDEHGFELRAELIEEATHCAMIGYMKYMRKTGVQTEEEAVAEQRKMWWYMDAEIYMGIMNMCPRSAFGGGRNSWKLIRVGVVYMDQYEGWDMANPCNMEERIIFSTAVQAIISQQTETDQKIIAMLAAGISVVEVGRRLGLSRQTTRTHIKNLRAAFAEVVMVD